MIPRLFDTLYAVSRHTGVSIDEIRSNGRTGDIVRARRLFVLIARDHCGTIPYRCDKTHKYIAKPRFSWPEIAREYRGEYISHSSAICTYRGAHKDRVLVQTAAMLAERWAGAAEGVAA